VNIAGCRAFTPPPAPLHARTRRRETGATEAFNLATFDLAATRFRKARLPATVEVTDTSWIGPSHRSSRRAI
jgi:hypothetical protein